MNTDISTQLQLINLAEDTIYDLSLQSSVQSDNIRKHMIAIRGKMGLSAEKFGQLCDITPQYVFRIEAGKATWSRKSVARFNANLKKQFACPTGSEPAEQAGGDLMVPDVDA